MPAATTLAARSSKPTSHTGHKPSIANGSYGVSSCPMSSDNRSEKWRRWWYGAWVLIPLLWLGPSLMTVYWPPQLTMFLGDMLFCALGSIAAWRTVTRGRSSALRVATGLLGSLYFLYLAGAGAVAILGFAKTHV